MSDILHMLEHIRGTTKRNEKLAVLRSIRDSDPWFADFLKYCYDYRYVFYVTADEDEYQRIWTSSHEHDELEEGADGFKHNPRLLDQAAWFERLGELCELLATGRHRGNAALESVGRVVLAAPTLAHVRLACRVLNKDMDMGVNVATVNAVWPGLVEEYRVALAETFDPERHELEGTWFFEKKLDGNRIVDDDCDMKSRNGKLYTSVDHIRDLLAPLARDFFIDGEMMTGQEFNASSGALRRKGERAETAFYSVFDLVPISEWRSRNFVTPLWRRKELMVEFLTPVVQSSGGLVRMVPWTVIVDPTADQFYAERDRHMAEGGEGAMAKRGEVAYVLDRSDAVLKVKKFYPIDGLVVDAHEHRKKKGTLGAVSVEHDDGMGGLAVSKCGSGFTKGERLSLWENRGTITGRTVEMEYQERTPEGKLRFPTFLRFRPDKD